MQYIMETCERFLYELVYRRGAKKAPSAVGIERYRVGHIVV